MSPVSNWRWPIPARWAAWPPARWEFLGVFAPTQLPLAVVEGILTMLVVMGLETYARPELRTIGYMKEV